MSSSSYLELARERVIIFDGATGTNLQRRELSADDFGGDLYEGCNEYLCLSRPEVVRELHRSFLEVGVDVIETNSFGALPYVLAEYRLADRTEEIARRSAELAVEVTRGFSTAERPRFVAGSLGPGTKLPTLGQISFNDVRDAYEVLARGLLAGGVDLLVVETSYDTLQAKAAIQACRRAMAHAGRTVPLQVQVTVELTGRMLLGTEIGAALTALEAMDPDIIGMNCATGPSEMRESLHHLSEHALTPISALPNAGLPSVVDGKMHYDLSPAALATHLSSFVTELGVTVIGGCCGTTPEHLVEVVAACRDLVPAQRHPVHEPGAASLYTSVPFEQDLSFLVIGERTNANGSKRFREAMLAADWETTVAMAKDQVREGAHLIDVCVDYTGADGVKDMTEVASRFAAQSTIPLVIDTTEPPVVEAALRWIGGRPILNSVNLEDGDAAGTRLDRILGLAKEYGAAVICTCIDTDGQARTADWKLRAARAIHDLAVGRYGLHPEDLLFDPLALPLSTGMEESRRDGIETIEAIKRIKAELPGTHTVLGLSNVSFGLAPAARQVLNSVFLHECTQAGLDAAIVHAGKILPLNRIGERELQLCLDLVYDRRSEGYDPLGELIAFYEAAGGSVASSREDRSDWPVERRLEQRIVDGDRNGLTEELDEALDGGHPALAIVNEMLLAGMRTVGELFGSGQMQLPFVLQSAETMKAAVAHLEPHMEKVDAGGRGRVVLATVKGDVHDIGKNLVDIILTNNGYEVSNLGIKVPIAEMIAKADDIGADAIGMSGLLVKSTLIMRENLEELNRLRKSSYTDPPRRRRPHAQLRREGSPGHLRGQGLLREGRLRRAPGARPAHGDQDERRRRSQLRDRAVGAGAPSTPERGTGAGRSRLAAGALARGGDGQRHLQPALPGQPLRQGHPARRRRLVPERDGALPQPMGLPARRGRVGRRLQGARAGGAARPPRRGQGRRHPRAGRSPGGTSRPTPTATILSSIRTTTAGRNGHASTSRASGRSPTSASPTSSDRSTPGTRTTPPSTSSRWGRPPPSGRPSSSPPTATSTT